MASSNSRAIARVWPFILSWNTRDLYAASSPSRRRIEEYISTLGVIQANEERRLNGKLPLGHATILTCLHVSPSDPVPHITIAAATEDMRRQNIHIAIHCRASSVVVEDATFRGSFLYEKNIRNDTRHMIQSHKKPVKVVPPLLRNDEMPAMSVRLGCFADKDGPKVWYILNEAEEIVELPPMAFYPVGEGQDSYLGFQHPILDQRCRAIFLGNEGREAYCTVPRSADLEAHMEASSIHSSSVASLDHVEWVSLHTEMGKDNARPLQMTTKGGQAMKSQWEDWEHVAGEDLTFKFEPETTKLRGREFRATDMPAELVEPWLDRSSSRPIHFKNSAGKRFETNRNRWRVGANESFFVHAVEAKYYMALSLPGEDES